MRSHPSWPLPSGHGTEVALALRMRKTRCFIVGGTNNGRNDRLGKRFDHLVDLCGHGAVVVSIAYIDTMVLL
jgi:hypothetical protein